LNLADLMPTFDLDPSRMTRSRYPGLVNLANTCYLNSILQQVCMTPGFRRLLQHADANHVARQNKGCAIGPEGTLESSLVYQLQKVLLNLEQSPFKVYNPSKFVNSFKGWTGEP